jgi:hypothetical protein
MSVPLLGVGDRANTLEYVRRLGSIGLQEVRANGRVPSRDRSTSPVTLLLLKDGFLTR